MAKRMLIKHVENPREISWGSSSADYHAEAIAIASKGSSSSSFALSKSIAQEAAASSLVGNNEDLLWLILTYLPPNSLLRFECVSKQWLSIISDPTFRLHHSRKYPTSTSSSAATTGLFLFQRPLEFTDINFISFGREYANSMSDSISNLNNFLKGKIMDLHSCNGLLVILVGILRSQDYDEKIVVYNPTTRQHRLIPRINTLPKFSSLQNLNIVFDPSKSDHYKLVCVWSAWGSSNYLDTHEFKVYSSETGVWKESKGLSSVDNEDVYFGKGVLWNGDLHWISGNWYTLCFDLENECLRDNMPSLPKTGQLADVLFFGVSGENLCVVAEKKPRTMCCNVFELERDYSKWNVKYYDLSPLNTLYPSMVDEKWQILCIPVDKKEKKATLVISLPGKVISYDIENMIVKEIADAVQVDYRNRFLDKSLYGWMDAHQHMETLACV